MANSLASPAFSLAIEDSYADSLRDMSALLESAGWLELAIDATDDDYARSFEFLSYDLPLIEQDALISGEEVELPDLGLAPNVLQFFFDLYDLGSMDSLWNDILVSYLPSEESSLQRYVLYGCDSSDAAAYMLEDIAKEAALIFPGRFLLPRGGDLRFSTRKAAQRTLHAVCVDIDPVHAEGVDLPLDAYVLGELVGRIPQSMQPCYICLTGRGVHMWYIFESPVQVFNLNSRRRRKLEAFAKALYAYISALAEDLPCVLDKRCAATNHGFRAPGSLTKRGEAVKCFCPPGRGFRHSRVSPVELSRFLSEAADKMGISYPSDLAIVESDVRWKTIEQINREVEEARDRAATEKQLELLARLEEEGLVFDEEMSQAASFKAWEADRLIKVAMERRLVNHSVEGRLPMRSAWRTKPHFLIAGKSGGTYRTILDRITETSIGNRYLSLHMLAGVAYMMKDPAMSSREVERDFMALLDTPWAKAGSPLTERDVKNALKGFCKDNWRTRSSIVETLGFDPFGQPAKRNGRSRSRHLEEVARPARAEKMAAAKVSALSEFLAEHPSSGKREAARALGMSPNTVLKYWDEALSLISCVN